MKAGDRVELRMPVNYPAGNKRIEVRTGRVVDILPNDGMAVVKLDGHPDSPQLRYFLDTLTRIIEGN